LLNDNDATKEAQESPSNEPSTRWEKAIFGLNGIVNQVAKIDPNGIDVVCFPGSSGSVDVYRNLKDTSNLEDLVNTKEPSGSCNMGEALSLVLGEALQRGFEQQPTSILVFTAGRPEDYSEVKEVIQNTASRLEKAEDLTVTFVQIGDDYYATRFLTDLATDLNCTSASGEPIDIVDTIKDEEIQKAVGEMKESGFMGKGGTGALLGGLAGAALGAGGMYLYNRTQAKKRTEGWNGEWKAMKDGEEIAILKVFDDMQGNLTIEGWPSEVICPGFYSENENGYSLTRMHDQNIGMVIHGNVEDEHNISWSDGTRWEEVPPSSGWGSVAAAGAAGAAAGAGAGLMAQKAFFKKAANNEPSEYVIVMDRSATMNAIDTGK